MLQGTGLQLGGCLRSAVSPTARTGSALTEDHGSSREARGSAGSNALPPPPRKAGNLPDSEQLSGDDIRSGGVITLFKMEPMLNRKPCDARAARRARTAAPERWADGANARTRRAAPHRSAASTLAVPATGRSSGGSEVVTRGFQRPRETWHMTAPSASPAIAPSTAVVDNHEDPSPLCPSAPGRKIAPRTAVFRRATAGGQAVLRAVDSG